MRLLPGLVAAACSLLGQDAQDPPVLFRERVNLVTVPVVVRDRQGRPVGNLRQEDFQLFDRGKPQAISRFTVEKTPGKAVEEKTPFAPPVEPKPAAPPSAVPERYVAYLFDDVHSEFGDLARVRDASWEHMQESLRPGDRAAVFTTSGQTNADFTDDRDSLHAVLLKMMPRPTYSRGYSDCPDLGHHHANLIINGMDRSAFDVAVAETMRCANVTDRRIAESLARGAAQRVVSMGEQGSRIALSVLRDVVRRMSAVPGQRVVLLASPGFVTGQENMLRNDVIDKAIKANVTINGLDARGLWVDSMFDASKPFMFAAGNNVKAQIEREAQRMSSDIVAELAYGTGGSFFQNSNDLTGGFRKLAEVPEYVYVLGFSPDNLKMDGSFHNLKVTVKSEEKLTANARRGYYAPKQVATAEDTAREEIREAVFSRQEARSFPLEVTTSGERGPDGKTQLAVEVKVPLQPLRYRVVDGRHLNTLTVVHAVFNHNGLYVAGEENTVELRLQPKTLESPTATMNAKKTYLISPGVYSVRVVARDSEERNLSTANATVEVR